MPRRRGDGWFMGLPELSHVCSSHHYDPSCATESQDAATEASRPTLLTTGYELRMLHLLVKQWQKAQERELRTSCVEPSSTTKARSVEPASRPRRNWCPTRRSAISARRWKDAQYWIWWVQDEVEEAEAVGRGPCWRSKQHRTKYPKQHSSWDKRRKKCHRSRNWKRIRSQPLNENIQSPSSSLRHACSCSMRFLRVPSHCFLSVPRCSHKTAHRFSRRSISLSRHLYLRLWDHSGQTHSAAVGVSSRSFCLLSLRVSQHLE